MVSFEDLTCRSLLSEFLDFTYHFLILAKTHFSGQQQQLGAVFGQSIHSGSVQGEAGADLRPDAREPGVWNRGLDSVDPDHA